MSGDRLKWCIAIAFWLAFLGVSVWLNEAVSDNQLVGSIVVDVMFVDAILLVVAACAITGQRWLFSETPRKDNCQVCFGEQGGVRGNENVIFIDGKRTVICDYCLCDRKRAGLST